MVSIKSTTKSRKLPDFSVNEDYLHDLWNQQDGKCAVTGLPMEQHSGVGSRNDYRGSLDRIDSSKGYVPGNVRWVCWFVNSMRLDRQDAQLFLHAKAIVDGLSRNTAG
jgi:hypothetical protein